MLRNLITAVILSFMFDIATQAGESMKKSYDCKDAVVCITID